MLVMDLLEHKELGLILSDPSYPKSSAFKTNSAPFHPLIRDRSFLSTNHSLKELHCQQEETR